MQDFNAILNASDKISLLAALFFILYGGWRRWWVWGYQLVDAQESLREMKQERDEWRRLAFESSASTAEAVQAASQVVATSRHR